MSNSAIPVNGGNAWWNYKPMLIAVVVISVLVVVLIALTIWFVVAKVRTRKKTGKDSNDKAIETHDIEKIISSSSLSTDYSYEKDHIKTPLRHSSKISMEIPLALVDQIAQGRMIFGSHKNLNKHINMKNESLTDLDDPFLDKYIVPMLKQSPVKRTRITTISTSTSSSSAQSSIGLSSALKDCGSPASSISVEHEAMSSPRQKKRPDLWLENVYTLQSNSSASVRPDSPFTSEHLSSNSVQTDDAIFSPVNIATPLTPRSPADSTQIFSVERVVMSGVSREVPVTPPKIVYGQALTTEDESLKPVAGSTPTGFCFTDRDSEDYFTSPVQNEQLRRPKVGVLANSFIFPSRQEQDLSTPRQRTDSFNYHNRESKNSSFNSSHPYDVELEIFSSFYN